jgi:hypothetical protein
MANVVDWPDELANALTKFTRDNPQRYPHARVAIIEAVGRFVGISEPNLKQLVSRARNQANMHKRQEESRRRSLNQDAELLRQVRAQLANGGKITDIEALKQALGLE